MARVAAITGASGMVGRALARALDHSGWQVLPLVRRPPRRGEAMWDPDTGALDAAALEGVTAVVHLAGETIGARWTPARKRRIRQSRVAGGRLLAEALARLQRPPDVLISASAVGIYGDAGDATLTEAAAPGAGFLAELSRDWEAAADSARAAGIRVVHPRFGMVLSPEGGALQRLLPLFRLCLGGPLASGRQWMSWITLDDAIGALRFALETSSVAGPVNTVAPAPVTNAEFTEALAAAVGRPAFLPVPRLALEVVYGQMAREVLLASQRALPARLEAAGFRFGDPELRPALHRVLG